MSSRIRYLQGRFRCPENATQQHTEAGCPGPLRETPAALRLSWIDNFISSDEIEQPLLSRQNMVGDSWEATPASFWWANVPQGQQPSPGRGWDKGQCRPRYDPQQRRRKGKTNWYPGRGLCPGWSTNSEWTSVGIDQVLGDEGPSGRVTVLGDPNSGRSLKVQCCGKPWGFHLTWIWKDTYGQPYDPTWSTI